MTDDIPHPSPPAQVTRSSLLEHAIVAYGSALVLALVALMLVAESETGTWLLIAPPVAAAGIGFATRARQIVWLAIGACLSIGILAIFSVGFVLLQIAVCLFGWWYVSSRRVGRPVFVRSDLWWEVGGLMPFLILAFGQR